MTGPEGDMPVLKSLGDLIGLGGVADPWFSLIVNVAPHPVRVILAHKAVGNQLSQVPASCLD